MMEKRSKVFLLGFIFLITMLVPYMSLLKESSNMNVKNNVEFQLTSKANYIEIDGNEQLKLNSSSGFGNSTHPYVLENYFVGYLAHDGITIKNTDAYFILYNCVLYEIPSPYTGIRLENVTNANITNNTGGYTGFGIASHYIFNSSIANNSFDHITNIGILIYDSFNLTIDDNEIFFSQTGAGISTDNVTNSTISNNNMTQTNSGLSISRGGNNSITNNIMCDCEYSGIYLYKECQDNYTNNFISKNGLNGIYFTFSSNNNTINNNTIVNNTESGVLIWKSHNNTVRNNTINNNTEAGVKLEDANYNVIQNNTIWDNQICINVTGTSTGNIITPNSCERPNPTENPPGDGTAPPAPPIPGFTIAMILGSLLSLIVIKHKKKQNH